MNAISRKLALAAALAAATALAGCASGPRGNSSAVHGDQGNRCQSCGVVQDVQQVDVSNGNSFGVVISAVAGDAPGHQTMRQDNNGTAWRIVVRLDNGQYATVTQRENSGIRNGDYVEVRSGQVYAR